MILFDGDELGGPLDLVFGLPLHPLVVHGAVVLVPLVAFLRLLCLIGRASHVNTVVQF